MSKICVPIGMDVTSTGGGGYFAFVCCKKFRKALEDIQNKKRYPFPDDYKFCPYCGERFND